MREHTASYHRLLWIFLPYGVQLHIMTNSWFEYAKKKIFEDKFRFTRIRGNIRTSSLNTVRLVLYGKMMSTLFDLARTLRYACVIIGWASLVGRVSDRPLSIMCQLPLHSLSTKTKKRNIAVNDNEGDVRWPRTFPVRIFGMVILHKLERHILYVQGWLATSTKRVLYYPRLDIILSVRWTLTLQCRWFNANLMTSMILYYFIKYTVFTWWWGINNIYWVGPSTVIDYMLYYIIPMKNEWQYYYKYIYIYIFYLKIAIHIQ